MNETKDQIPHNLPVENVHEDAHNFPIEHQDPSHTEIEKDGSDKAIKYVLIGGFLVILFVVSIGLVSFLPGIISNVSSTASAYLFSAFSSQPKITLSLDKTESQINQPFLLSWKNNTTSTRGSYSFSFKCTNGVTLSDANSKKNIVCGTLFPLGTDNGSIKLIPNSKNLESTDLPMNVSFFENGNSEPKLTNSISISVDGINGPTNKSASSNSSSGTNSGVTVKQDNSSAANSSTSNYYYPTNGKSDLSITLVKRGMIANDGSFVETSAINSGSRVMIQFNVANNGTSPSGNWSLNATLPTTAQNEKVFSSGTESSLRPGDSFTMSLSFDSFDPSANQAVLTLLSSSDSNMQNNNLTVPFTTNSGYSNNYNNNYYNTYSGNASLNIQITSIAPFNRSTGQFYYSGNSTIYAGNTVGVQFTVTNNGSVATGPWSFNANIPTNSNYNNYYNNNSSTYNYSSGTEPSLAPGQSATFTIAFDDPNIGSDTVNINTSGNSYGISNSASRTFYVSN